MILIDANLLVYAHVENMSQHASARKWLDTQLNGVTPVGLPWPSLLAFIRLVSNPRVFERPEPILSAWNQVTQWLSLEPVWIPQPTGHHQEILGRLIGQVQRPEIVPDAHLAVLAMEHGLTLCSADGDFARFPDLKWINPLLPIPQGSS